MATRDAGGKDLAMMVRRVVAAVLLINLFVITLVAVALRQSYDQHRQRAETTTQNLTATLAGGIDGTADLVNLGLLAAKEELERHLASGRPDAAALNSYMSRLQARLPWVIGLRATDERGWVAYGVDVPKSGHVDLSDRQYFIRLRDDPGLGLFVNQPVMSRINRVWVVNFARRLNRPDGSFAGVVFANIPLEQFVQVFASVDVGPHGAINLRDAAMGLIVRHPAPADLGSVIGERAVSPEFRRLVEAGQEAATFYTPTGFDNTARVASFRKVNAYPLIVSVSLAQDDYLAEWRREALQMSSLAGLFAVITLAAAGLLLRAWRRQLAAVEALGREKEEVRRLKDELEMRVVERTAQLAAANTELEEFSYAVSHDLSTPLRAIEGFSHVLLTDYGDRLDEEGRRLASVVRHSALHMARLIDGILAFLHLGRRAMRPAVVDLAALARDVFAELEAANTGRVLRLTVGALPPAWGDAAMLRELLACLLANAVKFSRGRPEALIEVAGEAAENENIYHVKDNGIGFDMRYADKLFRPFERVHPTGQFEGAGIGLALAKRIVGRHGGRVWAAGAVDAGATFSFALPRGGARAPGEEGGDGAR